jgi:hypothetical protein
MSPDERALEFAKEAFKTFGVSDEQIAEYAKPIADLIRDAIADAAGANAGAEMVLVPKEPTEAMTTHPTYINGEWSRRTWEASIQAALAARADARADETSDEKSADASVT